jgi:hypothetical protein
LTIKTVGNALLSVLTFASPQEKDFEQFYFREISALNIKINRDNNTRFIKALLALGILIPQQGKSKPVDHNSLDDLQ